MIKLGLIGSAGRMGSALREHLAGEPEIALAATLEVDQPLDAFIALRPDVAVDLSLGRGVDAHGPAIVEAGIPYIVGATGYSAATLKRLGELAERTGTAVLIVPNFSLGANLMIKFAAAAARLMHTPVITERHHLGKADAPSGTARFTAQRIAEALSGDVPHSRKYDETLHGVLGGSEHGVAIHSLRGEGYLAEQEVRLSLPGESLSIEHRSIDRRCFMPGIVYAIRNISKVRGLQIGLDTILEA